MICRSVGPSIIWVCAVLVAWTGVSVAAPNELKGKSVVVSWTEERMQRNSGQEQFRPVTRDGRFSVYVSTEGNVFNRVTMANPRKSGNKDRAGDTQNRATSFEGGTMTSVQHSGSGRARRIIVKFSADFSSCTADVIHGTEGGIATAHSVINPGRTVEIQSVRTGNAGCAVKSGNVFGGE